LAGRGANFMVYPAMTQDEFGSGRRRAAARVAWFKDPDGNTRSLTEVSLSA
jgi:hypothetical protein